jgi:hypothetical protein
MGGMLDNTDIDFNSSQADLITRRLKKRRVTKKDMIFNTFMLAAWMALLLYNLWGASFNEVKVYVFLAFWAVLSYPIIRDYFRLYDNYTSGKETFMMGPWVASGLYTERYNRGK